MKNSAASALLAVLLLTPGWLAAADKQPPPIAVTAPDTSAAWQRRVAQITSDGLPLGEVIKLLRTLFPEINFLSKNQEMVSEGQAQVDVNAVSVHIAQLRAVTLEEILQALELATDRPITITGKPDDRLVVFEVKTVSAPRPSIVQTRAFNLARYLDEGSAPERLKQVEDVISMAGQLQRDRASREHGRSVDYRPMLHFHSGTKLLIAVGRPDELEIVEQIVRELQGGGNQRTVPKGDENKPPTGAPAEKTQRQ